MTNVNLMVPEKSRDLTEIKAHKKRNIAYFLLCFMQMFFVFESLSTNYRWSKEVATIVPFVIGLALFAWNVLYKKRKINSSAAVFFIIVVISKVVTSIWWDDFAADNIVLFLVVAQAFFIASVVDVKLYWTQFVNVMLVMSVYSVIVSFVLKPIQMSLNLSFIPTYTTPLNVSFFDFGFSYVKAWYTVGRNQGYFREPGVYQVFLILALIILLYVTPKDKHTLLKIILLTVTIFTTASSIGIPIFVAVMLVSLSKLDVKRRKTMFVCLLILLIVLVLFWGQIYDLFLDRIFNTMDEGIENESFATRVEGPVNVLKETFSSPIKVLLGDSFVHGLQNVKELNVYNKDDVTGTHFVFMMGFGVVIGVYLIVLMYRFLKKICPKTITALILFVCLFLSINTQNLIYNIFLWMIMFTQFNMKINTSERVEIK